MSLSSEPPSSPPSPSPSPRSPLSPGQHECLCKLSDIITQLLHENPEIRFRCLAYIWNGHVSPPLRCGERFDKNPKGYILKRAKGLLEHTSRPISFDEYVGCVIKVLFCRNHTNLAQKCRDILQQHWTGDEGPEEMKLMETIRQAYIFPPTNSIPENEVVQSPSIPFSIPSRPRLDTDGPSSDPQLSTSTIRPDPRTVATTPSRPSPSVVHEEPPSEQEGLASPSPNLQNTQSSSSPTRPEDEISFAENRNSRGVPEVIEDIAQFPAVSDAFQVPNPEFTVSLPGLSSNIIFPRRQLNDEPLQTEPAPHPRLASEPILSSAETLDQPQVFAEASPDLTSTSPLVHEGRPAMQAGNPFSEDNLSSVHSSTLFGSQSSRPPARRFQAIPTRRETKDDLYLPKATSVPDPASSPAPAPSTPVKNKPEGMNNPSKPNQSGILDYHILRIIQRPIPTLEKFVYVLKAPGYFAAKKKTTLVKIGFAEDVRDRIAQLERDCGLHDLERVTDYEDEPTIYHKRIEDLAHEELGNFQRDFVCGSKKCKNTVHREWFEVPEDVALQVVQRWRRFIKAEPYNDLGILRDRWSNVMKEFVMQPKHETYDDHDARNKRWHDWLDKVIAVKEAMPTADSHDLPLCTHSGCS